MIVPPWAWWFTYLAVPLAAALLAVARRLSRCAAQAHTPCVVRLRKGVVLALAVSSLCDAFDFLRMLGDVNGFGSLVYLAILISQIGLAVSLWRSKPSRAESGFAAVAVATVITMLLVRAQVIWIFG